MKIRSTLIATLLLAAVAGAAASQPQPEPPPVGVFVTQSVEALRAQTEAHAGTWRFGKEVSWSVDQDRGVIEFLFEDGVVASAPVQIVGTYNPRSGTFLWGWDHPSVAEPLRRAAAAARAFGAERGVERYLEREVPCTEAEAWEFTAVAARLDGANGAYRADAGGPLVYMTFGEITLSRRP